jgi:hypothetical protein
MTGTYFALIGSSSETDEFVTWRVSTVTESEVIALAEKECRTSGEDLEFFAGFELIGTSKRAGSIGAHALTWSRDWIPGEKFKASLLKLGDEGRTFKAFNAANPVQVKAFVDHAASVGLGSEAATMTASKPQEPA